MGEQQPSEHEAIAGMAEILRQSGWSVDPEPSWDGAYRPDMLIARGQLRYVVELKVVREARRPLMRAMFAEAILQARAYARKVEGSRPLAVIVAPLMSHRSAEEIGEYAAQFAEGIAWGVVDGSGKVELRGEGLQDVRGHLSLRAVPEPLVRRRPDPFSDLGQWMLKVLLARHLDQRFLHAPRGEIVNASRLARMASVSVPSAARFVAELRDLDFLDESRRYLRLVRVRDLLESWRVASSGPVSEVRAQWLIPPRDGLANLEHALIRHGAQGSSPGVRACLGLFAASEKLGFRFVHGAPLHVYLEDISMRSLDQLGLIPAESGQRVDVIVRRPRFSEAVFRGCVSIDGAAVADLIQCWLDVSNHPARGEELAAHIWRKVLEPHLVERDHS